MDAEHDSVITNVRERPSSTDLVRQISQFYRTLRAGMRRLFSGRATAESFAGNVNSGFVGEAFMLQPASPPSMVLTLKAGQGYLDAAGDVPTAINSVTGLDDRESYKPLLLSADQSITVPAADATNARIDILEVAYDRRLESLLARDIFTAVAPFEFTATNVYKILAWIQDGRVSVDGSGGTLRKINYKTGTPAGSPSAPSVTSGYIKIAEVRVGATVTTLDYDVIRDMRKILAPYGEHRFSVRFTDTFTYLDPVTILGVNAPPGMRFCISKQAGIAGGFTLRILPGSAPSRFCATGTVHGWTVGELFSFQVASSGITTVDASRQTEMANATKSYPVLDAALGADIIEVTGVISRQVAGATGLMAADTDLSVDVSFAY